MRHRMIDLTGLGNSEPCELDNNVKLEKSEFWNSFMVECQKNFTIFSNYDGFDFHLSKTGFAFGIEPSYRLDELLIIYIDFNDINNSYIKKGIAFDWYGSNCTTKSNFIKIINENQSLYAS